MKETGKYVMKFENGSIISFGWIDNKSSGIGISPIPKQPFRKISEVLKEADNATNQSDLRICWDEILFNKKKYPLIELSFAKEHIEKLSNNINH